MVSVVKHEIVQSLDVLVKMNLKQVLCSVKKNQVSGASISYTNIGTVVGVSVGLVVALIAVAALIIIVIIVYTRYGHRY